MVEIVHGMVADVLDGEPAAVPITTEVRSLAEMVAAGAAPGITFTAY